MAREIKIFKSFEEQEKYHYKKMIETTPLERFKSLFQMQQWTNTFHPASNTVRTITIDNGRTE